MRRKFKVGQVVAITWQPEFRPEYGRIEVCRAEEVSVRSYDPENGDFYDRPMKYEDIRPLTKRERGA